MEDEKRTLCHNCIHADVCIANLRGTACEDCSAYHGTCEACRYYRKDKFGIWICELTEISVPDYGFCESWEEAMP